MHSPDGTTPAGIDAGRASKAVPEYLRRGPVQPGDGHPGPVNPFKEHCMLPIRLIFVLFAGLIAAAAASADDVATIRDQNGCQLYNPNPQSNETVRWSGACKDGFAEGEGVLEWYIAGQLEERYEGSMRAGWAEGTGSFISRQGIRYKGEWKRSTLLKD